LETLLATRGVVTVQRELMPLADVGQWQMSLLLTNLYVLGVDVEVLGEKEPEPGRVEVGAGSDDAAGREARKLPGDVGEHVHGVGHDEQQRVVGLLRQRRHDLAEQRHVPLEQVEPRLALDLPRPGRHDDQVRAPGHGHVGAGHEARARQERRRVLQVQHLPAELVRDRVHQRDLVGQVAREDGLRDGHPHVARADDRHLGQPPPVVLRRRRRRVAGHRAEEARRRVAGVEAQLGERSGLLHLLLPTGGAAVAGGMGWDYVCDMIWLGQISADRISLWRKEGMAMGNGYSTRGRGKVHHPALYIFNSINTLAPHQRPNHFTGLEPLVKIVSFQKKS
jgi:hypothetical protein